MVPNTFFSCGTKAIPLRARWMAPCRVTSAPSRVMVPLRAGTRPATTLSSVDLPAPFGPMTVTISPAPTAISTPLRISSAAP